ncbi:hypothetical protein B9G55_06525 [Saccharibacillus sp. O16]|nr:hypothetical protein B9G55_06525 [Saccharibacillus sp. O16]
MHHHCNLNIRYDLPHEQWEKVAEVYQAMPGWIGYMDNIPYWFGQEADEMTISASVEPSGLSLYARMEADEWKVWIETFKAKATQALGFEVGEPEDGFV